MVGKIPVTGLFDIVTAGDHMDCSASLGQLIERGELPGGKCWGHKAWAMRQEELEPVRHGRGVGTDEKSVWCERKIPDEYAVKPGFLVNACGLGNHVGIEDGTRWRDQLRRDAGRDPSNHFNWHNGYLEQ